MRAWTATCLLAMACSRDSGPPPEKLPLPDRGSDKIDLPPPPPPPPRRTTPLPPTPTSPPAPGERSEVVSPTSLEGQRVAGEKMIEPDAATEAEIARAGKTKLVVPIKVCLDDQGGVKSTTILKSSGFPAYDAKLTDTIESTWRFRPYLVDGTATAVCSAVTFIHVVR